MSSYSSLGMAPGLTLFSCTSCVFGGTQTAGVPEQNSGAEVRYRTADTPWAETYGRHRAVVEVTKAAEAVVVHIPWRRRDEQGKIRLLPAWPTEWNVDFKLHAPHRITVECKVQSGKITFLKVTPYERQDDVVLMNEEIDK